MKIGTLLVSFKPKGQVASLRRAEREFARGNNAAGVAGLLALGDSADAAVMYRLGEHYEQGIGVLQNFVEAVFWHERSAVLGMVSAMIRLGDIYLSGRVVPLDAVSKPASYESAGIALGYNRLRPRGMSVPRDFAKALYWNSRAAHAGAAEAQARLGGQYVAALGVPADYACGEKWLLASAEQGSASGQFGLGVLYAGTYLGGANNAKAAMWFEKSAAQGNDAAKLCLALLLIDGNGVRPDAVRAERLLTEAAEAGQTEAMFRLGELYQSGRSISQNLAAAETWLRCAGARGHALALLALARLWTEDFPTPDYRSAAVALRSAADLGNTQAQYVLGQLFSIGRGVLLDPLEAEIWFRKAAEQGAVGESLRSGT